MIIAAIILFALALAWDVITDYRKFLKRKPVNHTADAWLRVALLLPSAFCFERATNLEWYWSVPLIAVMFFFTWLLLFDGIYSTLIGQGFFFAGTTGKIDRVLVKWPVIRRAAFKIAGTAVSIFLYVKFYVP